MCSLLKLLILKFFKNVKVHVVMRQRNIWCVREFCVKMCAGLQSGTHLHTERIDHIDFYIFNKF